MISSVAEVEQGHPERGLTGEIYKFFELDPNAEWFNVVRQQVADDIERAKIRIPAELKPHFSFFYYVFYPQAHRFFFETRSSQNQLSPGLAAKMLGQLCEREPIVREFGGVGITVEPRTETIERILDMPRLRRLHIELTRPNADDLATASRKVMERLAKMNASSEVIELDAEKHKSLEPDEETRTLAKIARSNGFVEAEGRDADGEPTFESTQDHPLKERVSYDPQVTTARDALIEKSKEMLKDIEGREKSE
jgi:hypothetical protein